jgi:hypothetical protein
MAGASEKWSKGNGPAMLVRAVAVLVFIVSSFAAAAAGCGADSEKPSGSGGSGSTSGPGNGGSSSSLPGQCLEGTTKDCHVTLGQHGSVITCYAGTQECVNGVWGECQGGSTFERLLPGSGELERRDDGEPSAMVVEPEAPVFHTLGLTDAGPKMCPDAGFNDPCDPTCMGFPEVAPDGGIAITGVGNPGWKTGTLAALPGSITSIGIKNPCFTAADCQFNQYCGNPATDPSCGHNKCAPGAPLKSSCDPCVAQICAKAANAACCAGASCGHALCSTGAALASACDPCVTKICMAKPSCCTTTWDATCTSMVASTCGQTCAAWDNSCVKQVHDTCGDICDPPKAPCSHDLCYTGSALVNHCDDGLPGGNCVKDICAARPSCCTTAWDDTCASMVTSTCFKQCAQQGICDAWIADQTDPSCGSIDLTIGVPCFTQVPVCNIGTLTAVPPPGGFVVRKWPAGTGVVGTCNSNGGTDCTPVTVSIPPGTCVTTTCGSLTGGEEIMVNPKVPVAECQCQNNWAIYAAGAGCEPAVCTGPQSTFAINRVIMNLMVERSSATAKPIGAGTVWSQMRTGLDSFYNNPANATTFSMLSFFPDGLPPEGPGSPPATVPTCNTTTCSTATSCDARTLFSQISLGNFPSFTAPQFPSTSGPPTSAAFDGLIRMAKINALKTVYLNDTHLAVLVLASEPANCDPSVANMAAKAAAMLSTHKVRTFVIGIGVSSATTNTIAKAGGGAAFNILADANLGTNLATTLNSIRANIFPCSYDLPAPGLFDPNNPFVAYVSGAPPTPATETQVPNAAACGASDGYYYDDNANPTKVILCPNLCTKYRGAVYTAVKVVIACPTIYAPWSAPPQIYQASCPPGTQAQWGLFGYDAKALSDSHVDFKVQVAATQAGLATAPYVALGSAHSTLPDTQVCPVPKIPPQVPAPTCLPIDLYKKLGGPPSARYNFLQLSMDFTPSTSLTVTPVVNDWQITYSCVADQ